MDVEVIFVINVYDLKGFLMFLLTKFYFISNFTNSCLGHLKLHIIYVMICYDGEVKINTKYECEFIK